MEAVSPRRRGDSWGFAVRVCGRDELRPRFRMHRAGAVVTCMQRSGPMGTHGPTAGAPHTELAVVPGS